MKIKQPMMPNIQRGSFFLMLVSVCNLYLLSIQLVSADDDLSWGNLFGGWGGGVNSGRGYYNVPNPSYHAHSSVYNHGPKPAAHNPGYRANPLYGVSPWWYSGINTYQLPTSGGSSDEDERRAGMGAWGHLRPASGTNAHLPGKGDDDDSSSEEREGGVGSNPGFPVMHNVWGGRPGMLGGNRGVAGAEGDSSEESVGPVLHNIWNPSAGARVSASSKERAAFRAGGLPLGHGAPGIPGFPEFPDAPELPDWDLDLSDVPDLGLDTLGALLLGAGGGGVHPWTPRTMPRPQKTTTAASSILNPTPYPISNCQQAADVAVIVDCTDSMQPGDLRTVQFSLENLVDQLQLSANGRHMALMAYRDKLILETTLSGNPALLKNRIQTLALQPGRPDTGQALQQMISLMGRQGRAGVPKACIVLMDENSMDRAAAKRQALLARRLGIQLLVVGLGAAGSFNVDELRDLAEDSMHILTAPFFADLPDIVSLMIQTICPARRSTTPTTTTTQKPAVTSTSMITTRKLTTPSLTTPPASTPVVTTPRATTVRATTPSVTTTKATTPGVTTTKATTPNVATTKATTPSVATTKATTPSVATTKAATPRVTTTKATTPRVTTPGATTTKPTPASTKVTSTQTTPLAVVTTPKPTLPEVCDGCSMLNGVGYKAHWSQCDLFVQCQFLPDGSVTVRIKQCPHGLHWNQNLLTCTAPHQATCPYDRCRVPGTHVYAATSNCAGFWVCVSGRSEGRCCTDGSGFKLGTGCVPDPRCQDTCGVSPPEPTVCDKRSVAQMPLTFEQYVPGAGWRLMFCAPGSAYNHTQCACTNFSPVGFRNVCRPELYIPFNGPEVKDESGNHNFVQNEGVKVVNSAGYFDGNSVLRVPRFANTNYGDFVLIRLLYKQDLRGEGNQNNQALVANGDCLKPSSLYMAAGQQGVTFGAQETSGQNTSVTVPSTTGGGWQEAVLLVDKHTLTGSLNNYSLQTLFTGSLATSKCALQIGRGTNFGHFRGFMDDITVYLCRPTTF